ncbi:MAG: HAMP domain-containing sensor histidine kinase [Planctomycetaceae bacterium]|nr:HAMP domain-containing sensor histidine kinase [Planctomycetaceae bacterium]
MSRIPEIIPEPARLTALAEFAAGAGHEINNPLATIVGRAQQLLRDEADPQRRHSLSLIAAQAYRIRDMIGDVMAFARPPEPVRVEVDLLQITRQAVTTLATALADSGCSVDISAPQAMSACVDPAQFGIVIAELVRNAQQALQSGGGVILLRLTCEDAGDIVLEVIDHGQGFSDLERRHAFDPFFSGRQAGRGLGFGLCKVWQIVRQHGGEIVINSPESGPTCVRVTWPTGQDS